MFIAILIGAFIVLGVMDLVLRQKYRIKKNESFTDQFINKKHMFIEMALYVVFLMSLSAQQFEGKALYFFVVLFIAVVFAIRGLLEYIFRKNDKRYIVAYAYVMVTSVCAILILLFM